MQVHVQVRHPPPPGEEDKTIELICDMCGKIMYNKILFQRHVYSHTHRSRLKSLEPKYPCDLCSKLFITVGHVERHKVTHERTPNCDFCGEKFLNKIDLFNHRRIAHAVYGPRLTTPAATTTISASSVEGAGEGTATIESSEECDQCGKSFQSSVKLRRHLDFVHPQIVKFTCNICNTPQPNKSTYDRHMLSHTGVKPYICDVCGRGVTRQSDLIRHKRVILIKKILNRIFVD